MAWVFPDGRIRESLGRRIASVVSLLILVPLVPGATAAPAAAAAEPSFSFGAAGDFGYGANAQSTFAAAGAAGLDFFLALGDTTYDQTTEATWCGAFRAQVPNVLVQAGNHDTGENTGAGLNELLSACPYEMNETVSGRYGREWFFDYPGTAPLARFILSGCGTAFIVDSESKWVCTQGDAHYDFVSDAIDGARAAGIPWVIVGVHKNCITAGAKVCEIGEELWALLMHKRVDLILQGHDHLYGRSKQVVCATPGSYAASCVTDDGADGVYTQGRGSVLVIQGTGGQPSYLWNTSDAELPYFATGFSNTFGFTKFTVNASAISVGFVRSAGGNDGDSFVIEAPASAWPPPPPPGFLPGFDLLAAVLAVAACAIGRKLRH